MPPKPRPRPRPRVAAATSESIESQLSTSGLRGVSNEEDLFIRNKGRSLQKLHNLAARMCSSYWLSVHDVKHIYARRSRGGQDIASRRIERRYWG